MRILVTGGAGFIGTNLARRLITAGHFVRVFDDLSSGLASNLDELDVRFIQGDLREFESIATATRGVDCVVHLAARGSVPRSIANPMATHDVNATGTLHVLEAARRNDARVIVASSSSVYGANPRLPKTEKMLPAPLTAYAASKLAGEAYAAAYAASYGMSICTFRFFNVFGPWQRPDHIYSAVIPKWAWAVLHDAPITLYGDGSVSRDFTHVDDVTTVLASAAEGGLSSTGAINLAFGNSVTLRQVLDALIDRFGSRVHVVNKPPRDGDIPHSQNDPALLNRTFPGLIPTPFQLGFDSTVDWLTEHGDLVAGGPQMSD